MQTQRPILVLDTNTIVRGFAREWSHSGQILKACKHRIFLTLLSRPVLNEYRDILRVFHQVDDEPGKLKAITDLVDALRYVSKYIAHVDVHFELTRDPDDARFIELAIAGRATHIITHDKDLLSLPMSRSDAGKRFRQRLPGVKVQDAATFVREHPKLFR